jgi:redox-sensitive bicupin YhaK (pirin superfamily)
LLWIKIISTHKMTHTKSVTAALPLYEEVIRPGFSAVGMRHAALDPFMDVTLFSMSEPTFPPHPHAGFSAVTYMLPESEGSFANRDSLGDSSLIEPGAIHWTQAGAGMMHEEIPEHRGVACRGFQIFVKLPRELELLPPVAFHAKSHSVPVVKGHGWSLRVLAGAFSGISSTLHDLAHRVFLYDIAIEPNARVSIPLDQGVASWAMFMAGEVEVLDTRYAAPHGIFWSESGENAILTGGQMPSRIFMGGGKPLRESYHFGGPFALSTSERLSDARERFANGGMGALTPSF